jgi:choline dehydrogenase
MGIPVLHDLPNVGAHLSDHQGINYTWRAHVPTMNDLLRPWWGKLRVGLRYLARRDGPLALSINHAGGFFRTDPGRDRPNMQLYFQAFSTLLPRPGQRPVLNPDPFSGLSIGLSNCRPGSRGKIALGSPDPVRAAAHLRQCLLDRGRRRRDARRGEDAPAHRRARPLADLLDEELRPGPQVRTDAELIADHSRPQRHGLSPRLHLPDGARPGACSVVDARLRVHGLDGLRVCDASAFPALIAGNTNAPGHADGLARRPADPRGSRRGRLSLRDT